MKEHLSNKLAYVFGIGSGAGHYLHFSEAFKSLDLGHIIQATVIGVCIFIVTRTISYLWGKIPIKKMWSTLIGKKKKY